MASSPSPSLGRSVRGAPSLLLLAALAAGAAVLLSSSAGPGPDPAEAFLGDFFRGVFDSIIGFKRAIGFERLAEDLEEIRDRKKNRRNRRRRRRYRRRNRKGRSADSTVAGEYHRRAEEALVAAAAVDLGDCGKKFLCELTRRYGNDTEAELDETSDFLLSLFNPISSVADVRVAKGPLAQLDIAVALGMGDIGDGDEDASCASVYVRCPAEFEDLSRMLKEGTAPTAERQAAAATEVEEELEGNEIA